MAQELSVPTEPRPARDPHEAEATCRAMAVREPDNAEARTQVDGTLPGRSPRVGGTRHVTGVPLWDGSDPAGRTILVHCEPRLDDCVQFARYLPLLGGRRANVVVACPPPLLRLFGRMPGVRAIAEGDAPPPLDAQVSISSLPRLFDTTLATIPTFASYLRAAAPLVHAWRNRLSHGFGDVRRPRSVGFAWAGGDPVVAERLFHLAGVAGLRWLFLESLPESLGAGVNRPDRDIDTDVDDVAAELGDLADTAAVIAQLDLVIASGDSVAAHLAGALGKPVWTFVPASAGRRWPSAGHRAPWYPSMRLFRQGADGDWSDALDAAGRSLRAGEPSRDTLVA
jgi:hypothetical protein